MRTLVAIDPAGLTLAPAADGPHEGDLSLLALAVDRDGQIVGEVLEPVAVRLDAEAYARARQRGLRYGLRVPLKTAGGYQIRVAVRDDRSKALGTAAEFVEIPRVGKDRLALSGVVLDGNGRTGRPADHDLRAGPHGRVPVHRLRRPHGAAIAPCPRARPCCATARPSMTARGADRGRGEGRAGDRPGRVPRHAQSRTAI